MKYQSSRMTLNCIQTILKSPVNDICICEDVGSSEKTRYTVIAIKDHLVAKKLLTTIHDSRYGIGQTLIDEFSYAGEHILVFPYVKERPLESFYMSGSVKLHEAESICSSLVLSCIQSQLPFPILYLILRQKLVNLSRDMGAYLGYTIDFSELDSDRKEKDCVVECARIIKTVLEPFADMKADSYTLVEKRIINSGYVSFTDLYKDITIAASPIKKYGIKAKIRGFWIRNKDRIFKGVIVLSVIAVILAIAAFISQVLFGEVVFLRLFFNNFKHIGTEYLNR